jgi:hypothetical protein
MTAPTQTFKHGEHVITLTSGGKFCSVKDGKPINAGSLVGIKKKLDATPAFDAFTALRSDYWDADPVVITVIATKTVRRGYGPRVVWVLDNGQERDDVINDTPENRKLLKAVKVMHAKHERQKQAMADAAEALAAKITRRKPGK